MRDIDREEVFEREVAPLLEQMRLKCMEHGLPMICLVEMKHAGSETRSAMSANVEGVVIMPSQKFIATYMVQQHGVNALTGQIARQVDVGAEMFKANIERQQRESEPRLVVVEGGKHGA